MENDESKGLSLELGGFRITAEFRNGEPSFAVESISGQWSMTFGSELPQYLLIGKMIENPEAHEYLHTWLCMIYQCATVMPDLDLMGDWLTAIGAYVARNKEDKGELSEEEMSELNAVVHAYEGAVRSGDEHFNAAEAELELNRELYGDADVLEDAAGVVGGEDGDASAAASGVEGR